MGLTGKYDFKGIKKYGALGLETALSTTSWGAVVLKIPVIGTLLKGGMELFVNWLANEGLMVLNIAAISVNGEIDQKNFDAHMDDALNKVSLGAGKLTPAQQKEIDDAVIVAFRKFAKFTA